MSASVVDDVASEPAVGVPELTVESVGLRFGGIAALDDVTFTVRPGSIHALIGPNGAGKSSCFNVICGVYRPTSGRVLVDGRDITNLRPHERVRLGIGRSFQNVALSTGSTVLDNVMLGRHTLTRGGFVQGALRLPNVVREERRHRRRVAEICDFLGISNRLHDEVRTLPYGITKLVDIARAVAVEPSILLLDEPAAGLDANETQEMASVIRDLASALGISILLVEHDMGLVMRVAEHITVLDFGRHIAEGTPAEIQKDPAVISAYLGTGREA